MEEWFKWIFRICIKLTQVALGFFLKSLNRSWQWSQKLISTLLVDFQPSGVGKLCKCPKVHIHWSATTLNPLTGEKTNTANLTVRQCAAGEPWLLAFIWTLLTVYKHCCRPTPPHVSSTPSWTVLPAKSQKMAQEQSEKVKGLTQTPVSHSQNFWSTGNP